MRTPASYTGQPIRSLQTMLRLLAKYDSRCIPIVPDGIYGPETSAAVARFQQLHGLPTTGAADQTTWDRISAEYETAQTDMYPASGLLIDLEPHCIFRQGCSRSHVLLVQSMLHTLASHYHCFAIPPLSGTMDEATIDSVSGFQKLCGLPATGEVDKITWLHLTHQYPLAANMSDSLNFASGPNMLDKKIFSDYNIP